MLFRLILVGFHGAGLSNNDKIEVLGTLRTIFDSAVTVQIDLLQANDRNCGKC